MEYLIKSDISVEIINHLSIESIIRFSETTKNMKELLLEKINEYFISCETLIEFIALISEKKYTKYSQYLVREKLSQNLFIIDNFEVNDKIDFVQTLLELKPVEIIKKYYSDNLIVKHLKNIHEFGLSDKTKEYIINCVLSSIKLGEFSPELIFNNINPNNVPLLAQVLKENFPMYNFSYNEDIIDKFINIVSFSDNDFFIENNCRDFIYYITGPGVWKRNSERLKRITIKHLDLILNQKITAYQIYILMSNMLKFVSYDVLDQILTKEYSSFLLDININSFFLTVEWKRYKKLIPWMMNEGLPFDIINQPLIVMKLYLFYHPDKSTELFLEIYRNVMVVKIKSLEIPLFHIISYYKCDYEKILKFILDNNYKGEVTELVKILIEKHR